MIKVNDKIPQPIKELVLPLPHYKARMVRANETYMLAGRGTFKTSKGIALYNVDMVYEMPRSTGVAVGLSFEHLGDNTIPPLLQALQEFGLNHGEHYVIGKRPPKEWPKPFLGVLNEKYDHVMTWHNGTIMYLVSLVKKASANGISAQWGFFDETKYMNEQELIDDIFPIFRGNEETKKMYQHCGGYLSKFFATDKKADPSKIKWLLNKRKLVDQKRIDTIISLGLELSEMQLEFESAGINRQKKLKPVIEQYQDVLQQLRSRAVYVVEVAAKDVVYAHGQKWYDDKKRGSKEYDFKITYDNEDPDAPGEVFYPAYKETIHCYEDSNDIEIASPFIIASDYQHSVAPVPIAQISRLPGEENPSLNYVDALHTVYPQGLRDAITLFCNTYQYHANKHVYFVYDHTAIGKRVDADDYITIVKDELEKHHWNVTEVFTGMAPGHYQKFMDTKDWMDEKDPEIMTIRINKSRCFKLRKSISAAPAVSRMVKGKAITSKDKRFENTEKYPGLDQSETTHFSDAFDMINDAVLKQKLITFAPTSIPMGFR